MYGTVYECIRVNRYKKGGKTRNKDNMWDIRLIIGSIFGYLVIAIGLTMTILIIWALL